MVPTDKLKKPHPYFGAPQSAKADGKEPFIHHNKKSGPIWIAFFIFFQF